VKVVGGGCVSKDIQWRSDAWHLKNSVAPRSSRPACKTAVEVVGIVAVIPERSSHVRQR
jgi:hypothetical protein